MKITQIALGAGAGCLLMAGSALAGPCTANIEALSKQLQASDAGLGPTENGGGGTLNQSATNPVSPSSQPQATTPATGTMNEASQNKATSPQDVQNQNTGEGTMADQGSSANAATTVGGTNSTAAASLERAKMFDQAGNEQACMDEVTKAQGALAQ